MYFILEADNTIINSVCHLIYSEGNGWGTNFLQGCPIEFPAEKNESIYINFECDTLDLPDYFEVDGIPVVSKKLSNVLKRAAINNIQEYPADVYFTNGKTGGYYVLNIVSINSCIDTEASIVTRFGKHIMRILDLKVHAEITCTTELFRDPVYKQIIFISSRIKKEIEASGISGCNIRSSEGWSDSHRF